MNEHRMALVGSGSLSFVCLLFQMRTQLTLLSFLVRSLNIPKLLLAREYSLQGRSTSDLTSEALSQVSSSKEGCVSESHRQRPQLPALKPEPVHSQLTSIKAQRRVLPLVIPVERDLCVARVSCSR